jgi:hypothetical protein
VKVYHPAPEEPKLKSVFKYNDYYARVSTYRAGHTISAGHQASLAAGKPKRIAGKLPHSMAKKRTFKENRFDIDPAPWYALFLHTEALSEIEPEHFSEALKGDLDAES